MKKNKIMWLLKSIKNSKKEIESLETFANEKWGEFYWLETEFQKSNACKMMEKHSHDIHYYFYDINSSINLN